MDIYAAHLQRWETGEQEVGLLYQDNVLKDIKPLAQRGACWQGQRSIEIRKLDISTDFKLPKALVSQLLAAKEPILWSAAYGIDLKTVGARDIVLPGDMKAMLAQVVEAEKRAEANQIRRREETQETRSLHNTAKVMEGNPVLLRLKELEILEKITGRISTLNVYGGLDGVMNDLVKLTDKTKAA